MMKKTMLGAAFVLGLSASAFAQETSNSTTEVELPVANETKPVDVFAEADALYAIRDQGDDAGLANTLAARAAYQKIIDSGVTEAELTRAVEGLARTYYFQGEVLIGKKTDAEKKARKAVWNECWKKAIEPLSPKKFGSLNPVYFYFRASCMAHEAEVSTVLERLAQLPTLLTTFKDGNAMSEEQLAYEGGGFARVQAAIYGNIEAKPLGIFKPEEAIAMVDASIGSAGYSITEAPAVTGDFFCENYYRKAMIQSVNNQVAEAKALSAETIDNFTAYLEAGDLIPESIRAETKHCVEQITEFAAGL